MFGFRIFWDHRDPQRTARELIEAHKRAWEEESDRDDVNDKTDPRFMAGYEAGLRDGRAERGRK
jgi:hypothetical protein